MFYLSFTQTTALQKGNIKICVCAAMRLCVAATIPSPVPVTTVPYLVQRAYYTETSCNNRLANGKKIKKTDVRRFSNNNVTRSDIIMNPEPGDICSALFLTFGSQEAIDFRIANSKHMNTTFPT